LAYAIYDNGIMRTIVDLTDEQVKSLAALCAAQGISRAEAVRRAVTRLLAEEHRPGRQRAFGAWAGKAGDGAETVRRLRDEWER
jgi:Arc/MetJ-type ribon-helix-helix transcriptional regulator